MLSCDAVSVFSRGEQTNEIKNARHGDQFAKLGECCQIAKQNARHGDQFAEHGECCQIAKQNARHGDQFAKLGE